MRMHLLEETTVRTEWTRAPGPVDAYEIQFIPTAEGGSPPFTARVPSSASAYDQRGLAPGQEYEVTVRALRGTSWGPPASKTITTMIDGPQDLRVVAVTPTTLDLSWLRPLAEVDRFVVSYVSAGNQRVRLEVPPEADRALLTDLMPGVEYVVTVTAERGRAVSYPTSVRANTAPAPYRYPEVRPPAAQPQPRPRPAPASWPPRPSPPPEPEREKPSPGPPVPQPPRRAWGNLTAELGRFRGTVQDLERHLRAHGYPLRANQTYASVARHLHEFLQRRPAPPGRPASPPRRAHPAASPAPGTSKRDSSPGSPAPRHPKPEVLGSSADGALLVSLDGLRGQFERVVLRWWPEPPAEGPGGELSVPGTVRTVRLPDLRPGTTYHVEAHGVRAGRTSKSYAFVTTTGNTPLGATDEPPPAGSSTTQGVEARVVQRPQELADLKVLGRDETGRLHVAWTVKPDTFDHLRLHLQVPEGAGAHEELLPGDAHQALVPPPPTGAPYTLLLHGILPGGKASVPITYHGTIAPDKESKKAPGTPRLEELTVTTSVSPDSLLLHWTVPEGDFDSFVIQYKDRGGPQVLPVEGPQRSALITSLEPGRKYKFILYGLVGKKRHGPLVAEAKTLRWNEPSLDSPPRLGKLWVTDPTPDSLHLTWTVPQGQFDSFLVQYRDRDGQPQVVPVEGPDRSVTVSLLDPGHQYRFSLFGVANKKRYGPLIANGTTAPERKEEQPHPEPPEQPVLGELTVTGVTPDSLRLSWTVAQGPFDSFVVQYKDARGQPQTVPVGGDENELTVPGLESNRKYKMNLYGLRGRQRVGPASVVAKTAPQETPDPTEPSTEALQPAEEPRLGELTVRGASPDSLSLSWTVPEGHFDHFLLQYRNGDGQPKVLRVPGHEDQVTISGLEPDHKYKVHLYGFHSGQREGPVSVTGMTAAEESPRPLEPSTEAPEVSKEPLLGELTVTDTSPESLTLSWTVAQGHFDTFSIQYKDEDGRPQVLRVGGEERQATVRDLAPGHKYKMNLYGLGRDGRVGPVSAVATTAPEEEAMTTQAVPTTTPEPPRKPHLGELMVTGASPDSLSLSWTVPEGHFDHFLIQYRNGDGQPKVLWVPGHEDQVTVSGLEPDHKYKVHLYGFHSGQREGPVSVTGVTAPEEESPRPLEPSTEAPEPPKEPLLGELTVTDTSPDSLSLSWTVDQGHFDAFSIQYKDEAGRPQVLRVGGEERQATVRELAPGHKYKMNLYGLGRDGRVGPVSAVAVTAPKEVEEEEEETPSPPERSTEAPEHPEEPLLGELTVTDTSPDSLSLSWTVAQGHFDAFSIQYKDRSGQLQVLRVGGEEREATVRELAPGRKYKMNLYGLGRDGRVGPVSTVATTAPEEEAMTTHAVPTMTPEPPRKPHLGELMVTGTSPDSLSLSWTVPEGHFDHFLLQYRNGDGQPKVLRVPGHEDQVTILGLEPDHNYKVHLYGFHSGQREGPVSVTGVTAPEEKRPSPLEPSTEAPEPSEEPLLGELTVTDTSPDSLSLSWTVDQGHFDAFSIQYKDEAGRPQVLRVGGEERQATVRELAPGRKYKMNLYGLGRDGRVGPVSTVAVTAPLPTEPPVEPQLGELAVASVTSDTVHLSWTVAQGPFDSFLVQYRDAQGQPQTVPVSGDLREARILALHPARKYKFLLFGLLGGKRRGPISVDTKTLPDVKPTPRLGELMVTERTPHSLGLSWTVLEGEFDSFEIQYKDKDGRPQVVPVAADQRSITVPGLEPSRRFQFLLYGLAGRKRLGPISADGVTAPLEKTTPSPPRLGDLAASTETSDTLRLTWTVAQGSFDSFLVQYRDSDGRLQVVPVAADQHEVIVEGLEPGRTYRFLLFGLAGGQRVGPVSALGATAPKEDAPDPEHPESHEAPRLGLLAVTEATPDSLRLSWSVAQGPFDSFVVQYEDTDGQPQALLVDGDQSRVLISGLQPGTSYMFFLYGLHGGKRWGPVSAQGSTGPPPAGQTPGDPGPRLSQLSVTDVTTSSLRLNWEAPLGAFDSFLLRFGVPMPSTLEPHLRPPMQRELMVPGSRRSAVLRDLRPGTLYSLTLYGLRGPHKADSIQGTARTLSPVLESPRDLQFSDIQETSARVSWTPPPSRVDSFKVSYQLADGGEPQSVQVDGRAHTHSLQGLTPGARYEVTVVSVRGFEESEPLTGFLNTVPDGPTQLRALNLTEGSALLHWTPPQNPVDKYSVRVTAPGAPPLQGSAPGIAEDYPLHSLLLHTNYTATVRGQRGRNLTSPASVTFTTGLQAPQDLQAKEVTPRTALLTWTEPPVTPTGYLLSLDTPGGQTQEILLPAGVTSHRLLGLFPSTPYNARLRAAWGASLTPPVSTSFTTGSLRVPFPRDCGEEMQNGVGASRATTIFLNGNREQPLSVFCDMETDGGGWLVFQRRVDGRTDFWRDWEDYAHGFGNISGEFWLGNEALHSLTQAGDYAMRVDLRAGDEAVFAQYDSFRVDSAAQHYRLHLEGFHGSAGDSMSYHSGSVFSARDRDPNNLLISCAVSYRGAWWYRNCHYANLNGLYGSTVDHQGVSWYHWKGFDFSIPFTEMKLRPRGYRPPARGG
ncbi:tenascin-X isoform X14 [Octodon degus]|uniref:Tenascin-X isoform X14 n=1 Tax=Octodon degus TaxID=10160 RepID=A0A6P6EY18_OCTDE|nr:tenascin-X isoform X14 [Octodon degus]